jgi:hypothetical protein
MSISITSCNWYNIWGNAKLDLLLSPINQVFCDPPNFPHKTVVSQSKVEKGDAAFDTKKRLLGWDVDSQSLTLHLPNRRSERIGDLLASFLSRKYTTRKQWYNLLGKLCSITLALHSSPYLFSILQTPLTKNTHRFWLTRMLKLALQDWTNLIRHMSLRPVHITSVAPPCSTLCHVSQFIQRWHERLVVANHPYQ